jgi:hydroxyquinol 1,2-dioxygenase
MRLAIYFEEAKSVEAVNSRLASADPRFQQIMTALIKHLHAFVKEIEPSMDEWFQAIQFLTKTGQMCDDKRQEWILLSDTLGVSMLVDAINHRRPGRATENTVLGPFHVQGAPRRRMADNICLDGKGDPCFVSGQVIDEEGRPISEAVLDVWQTNDDGFYDVQQPGVQPDYNMRGMFETGADGKYSFQTTMPLPYSIPDDGTVGAMLKKMGRHSMRPAHIHFIVERPGYERLVTHIFVRGGEYLESDAVFGVKEDLIADFVREGNSWCCQFDICLKKSDG